MRAIHLILISLVFGCSFQNSSAEVFSEFGIIRANIAHYCSGHRWLVCCEPKRFPEASEVVGFDSEGGIFRIRGDLRPGAKDMLSLESYEKPSVAFSTKEGYFYIWNAKGGENPFEFPLSTDDYKKLIKKFELYPLLGDSKDGPISFVLLKDNPDYYDRMLLLPRPKSMFHLENPTARRVRVGIYSNGRPNAHGFSVRKVEESLAAYAAGLQADDQVTKFVINGVTYDMEKGFPPPYEDSIRIISLRVTRKTEGNKFSFLNLNIFPPSPLELFLFK